ncbi:MAG TPA: 30S ribosomal protein S20 [Candidatus Binatia bacterium]
MANHPSAEKRHRQSVKRAARNQAIRSRVRTAVKKLRGTVAGGDAEQAKSMLPKVASTLDKAVSKGVLHKNAAARRISRLAKQVAKLG